MEFLKACRQAGQCLSSWALPLPFGVATAWPFVTGALVGEGKTVPDNALVVGSPARQIRENDEATIRLIEKAADVYFKRWQAYASGLTRI